MSADRKTSKGAWFASCAKNVPDDPNEMVTSTSRCAALKAVVSSSSANRRSAAAATRTIVCGVADWRHAALAARTIAKPPRKQAFTLDGRFNMITVDILADSTRITPDQG